MHARWIAVITLTLGASLLLACGDSGDASDVGASPTPTGGASSPTPSGGGSSPTPPGAEPSPTQPAPAPSPTPSEERRVVAAPIDDLQTRVRESAPPQYAIRVLSGLPNGCARFNEAKITDRTGTTIEIKVTNTMPSHPNIACTAIYGTHETTVELGTDFVSGTEYVVRVNDQELRFTAQ